MLGLVLVAQSERGICAIALGDDPQALVRDLNHLYCKTPALHARDCEGEGFEWLLADDRDNSIFAWLRKAPDAEPIAVISNFTPVQRDFYEVPDA